LKGSSRLRLTAPDWRRSRRLAGSCSSIAERVETRVRILELADGPQLHCGVGRAPPIAPQTASSARDCTLESVECPLSHGRVLRSRRSAPRSRPDEGAKGGTRSRTGCICGHSMQASVQKRALNATERARAGTRRTKVATPSSPLFRAPIRVESAALRAIVHRVRGFGRIPTHLERADQPGRERAGAKVADSTNSAMGNSGLDGQWHGKQRARRVPGVKSAERLALSKACLTCWLKNLSRLAGC
jgi:hypothetical protein